MSLSNRRRGADEEDTELDLVPIMNMFLVLIPFLLLSASFYQIKAINTSIPVLSSGSQTPKIEGKSNVKVTVIIELKTASVNISAMSDELAYEELVNLQVELKFSTDTAYPTEALSKHLSSIKNQYPNSDTVIIVPSDETVYDTIIQAMDTARKASNKVLFPNVVLSGKVG